MKNRIYTGNRKGPFPPYTQIFVDSQQLSVEPSLRIRNHSLDVEWGYRGSGPTQLAVVILLDCFGEDVARRYYAEFRDEVVSTFDYSGFVIMETQLQSWLENKIKENGKR